jgi:hypothetical protein
MKSLTVVLLLAAMAFALMMTGCAGYAVMQRSPATGSIYTDVKAPMQAASVGFTAADGKKVGMASATSILGWIGQGDASIDAAMKAGGITKVHHVDFQVMQVLGLYSKYTTIVYGE